METSTVRRYKFSRAELRSWLLRCLQEKGIQVKGETRLVMGNDGAVLEEFVSQAGEKAGTQAEMELSKQEGGLRWK